MPQSKHLHLGRSAEMIECLRILPEKMTGLRRRYKTVRQEEDTHERNAHLAHMGLLLVSEKFHIMKPQ